MGAKLASAPGHGGGKRGRQEVTAEPNVIPFIDVMLVLLIIFMIAAPIASVDISVDMPESKIMPSKRPPKPTWISVQDQGAGLHVFVMDEEVPFDRIGQATYDAVNTNTPELRGDELEIIGQRVYIRADSETAYRNIVRVMNQLQNRGFTKIGLVTEDRRR
ncbi:MAG: biopolymer transporter ExbD [Caulobacterales bacterium]